MSQYFKSGIIPERLSREKLVDAGSALALIFLIFGFFTGNTLFYKLAIPVIIINMVFPRLLYPFALLWYGLSNFLGIVISRMILTIIYVIIIIPMGLARRLMGKDALDLKQFKKNRSSVLKYRNYTFSSKDLEYPY